MNTPTPFDYSSPDGITPQDIVDLFVPVFGEYYNIPTRNHTFINGARGSGKSMIFRFMEPECQQIYELETNSKKKEIRDLDYFAIHIPIKEGILDRTDLDIIRNKHGDVLLNEHFMVLTIAIKIFSKLYDTKFEDDEATFHCFKSFFEKGFKKRLWYSGQNVDNLSIPDDCTSHKEILDIIKNVLEELNRDFTVKYLRKLINANTADAISYNGIILTYVDFLFPLLQTLKSDDNIFPSGPIHLLIDDADNLNVVQTTILNSWVSTRTINDVCFKISTQQKYKTYKTINGARIETPHDYSEINISDTYTSQKGLFKSRVTEAITRRLKKSKCSITDPSEFFPENVKQEKAIADIYKKYKEEHNNDFAYRYSRPDYIRDNISGNRGTYSYAGFKQLVNISSGTMREFIEFAKKMYSAELANIGEGEEVSRISPSTQDKVIRDYSEQYFAENFDKITADKTNDETTVDYFNQLKNLVIVLGESFKLILLSDNSERRVFSFALQDTASKHLRKILELGVTYGYFQSSTIGNKMGSGRTELYILNRLLAPYFGLDPTSFASYKFITSGVIEQALKDPRKIIGQVKRKGADSTLSTPSEPSLFKNSDYEN